MAEYTPLKSSSPFEDDDEKQDFSSETSPTFDKKTQCRDHSWFTILLVVIAVFSAAAYHINILSAPIPLRLASAQDLITQLELVDPNPNLAKGNHIMTVKKLKWPKMWFPKYMVRANAAEPNQVYSSSSSIVLSGKVRDFSIKCYYPTPTTLLSQDTMFFHWNMKGKYQKCYIAAWVSPPDAIAAANKTYFTSEGDTTAIEVWNVSTLLHPSSISWNTRPERQSLMGTVNFTRHDIQNSVRELDGQELRSPTPTFDCMGKTELTVEIACTSCRLEFEQVFVSPALGFELIELA